MDYTTKKDKGLITLSTLGNRKIVTIKQFDPNTAEPTEDLIKELKIEDIERDIITLQTELDSQKALLEDLKSLDKSILPVKDML